MRKGFSQYIIMDKGRKRQYNLKFPSSISDTMHDESKFMLSKDLPDNKNFELQVLRNSKYDDITCSDGVEMVFTATYLNKIDFQDAMKKTSDYKIIMEVKKPTDRLFAFAVCALIMFRFQKLTTEQ